MTIEKAIEILTPGGIAKTPAEYETAHKMAVLALKIVNANQPRRAKLYVEMEAWERGEV